MESIRRILILLSEIFLQKKKPLLEEVALNSQILLLLLFLLFIVFQINLNCLFLNIDILLNNIFYIDIVFHNGF